MKEGLVFFGVLTTLLGINALDGPPKLIEEAYSNSENSFSRLSENPVVVYPVEGAIEGKNTSDDESTEESSDEKPTRPDYKARGAWARGELPRSSTDVGFVPQQIYAQVRQYETVERLPQEEALKDAKNSEEAANAARLREVLSHKKIQQVYEEEGYEDDGYDHAGYDHRGAKYEDNEKSEEIQQRKKNSNGNSAKELDIYLKPPIKPSRQGASDNLQTDTGTQNPENPLKIFLPSESATVIGRQTNEPTQVSIDDEEKPGEKGKTSREIGESNNDSIAAAETRSAPIDETDDDRLPEGRVINRPTGVIVPLTPPPSPYRPRGRIVFPESQTRRLYGKPKPLRGVSDVFMQESVGYSVHRPFFHPISTNIHHYLVAPAFPTFFTESPPPQAFASVLTLPSTTLQPPPSASSASPVQFASADTLNAFATVISSKDASAMPPMTLNDGSTEIPDKIPPILPDETKTTARPAQTDRPRRRKPQGKTFNTRNKPYSSFNRTGVTWTSIPDFESTTWSSQHSMNTRHPSLPRDSSETKNASKMAGQVKHVEQLTLAHFASAPPPHLKSPPQVQSERLKELARQLNTPGGDVSAKLERRRRSSRGANFNYDGEKYPFYGEASIHKDSALRYASNPALRPRKTAGGMEFYESRDDLVQCPESPDPPSNPAPERVEDGQWNDKPIPDDIPRIKGVGETIKCLKVKYFGEDPFDNPFFKEAEDFEGKERRKKSFFPLFAPTKRIMIIPSPTPVNQGNHVQRLSDRDFPYNHKPETAPVSPTVQKLRGVSDSPYPFVRPNQEDSVIEPEAESTRNKFQFGGGYGGVYTTKVKSKNVVKKKRRYRPFRPVAIYSIFGTLGGSYSPQYYNTPPFYNQRPYYAESAPIRQVIPVGEGSTHDYSVGSDKKTTLYVVRPGEYTENKELALESQNSGIWSYLNPLKWFPNYFDNRRHEPRFREKREVSENHGEFTVPVFPASATLLPANHRPDTTTGAPISLSEYRNKFNLTAGGESDSSKQLRAQARLNRLTGALQLRSSNGPSSRKLILPLFPDSDYITTPSTMLQALPPLNAPRSTESSLVSSTNAPGKGKFKILFPRTKAPPKRTSLQLKKATSGESREITPSTTTTTSTTTTQSPSTTTRMYKPKRIVKKPYNLKPGTPLDMFNVLKTTRRSSYIDSGENRRQERDEPRMIEHRVVTKEEVVKTSFLPKFSERPERQLTGGDQYSVSATDDNPIIDLTTTDNHTLTYLVNPVTGVGSWTESPPRSRERKWKPRKKRRKPVDSKESPREDFRERAKSRNKKRQSDPQFHKEAFIMGLLGQVPPVDMSLRSKYRLPSSLELFADNSDSDGLDEMHFHTSSDEPIDEREAFDETELSAVATKAPTQFILDPSKRKYYYVND